MKKIKTFVLLLICLMSGTFFFACDKTVKVESVEISKTEITLTPENSEEEIEIKINPLKATNQEFKLILTDDSYVSVIKNENDKTKATVKANFEGLTGTFTTFLQAESVDGKKRSELCKIVVYTEKTKLFSPQNLNYNAGTQQISWDAIDSASGYKLKIEIKGEQPKEEICATNMFEIDEYFNKEISVQVKSLGDGVEYTDSDYSEATFKFMQLEEPKNLRNNGYYVLFDKVENADRYEIYVYENNLNSSPKFTKIINDNEFDENLGTIMNALKNPGKNYLVKVKAFAEITDDVKVYESKSENFISVSKIATPVIENSGLKFTYSSNTISWKTNANALGYKLIRYKKSSSGNFVIDKPYEFTGDDAHTSSFVVDLDGDKLEAGVYGYSLTILGNNSTYLNSDESDKLEIEKLSSPTITVKDGILNWNEIENIGGYKLSISYNGGTENLEKDFLPSVNEFQLVTNLNETFDAGTYSFKIASVGNETNTITSEYSENFVFDKLEKTEKATLLGNQYLKFNVRDDIEKIEIFLTGTNNQNIVFSNQRIIFSNFVNRQVKVDMLNGTDYSNRDLYRAGNYKAYAVVYAKNMLKSEPCEIFEFEKLNNESTINISNGVLTYSKPENVNKVEVFLNDVSIYSLNPEDFNINSVEGFIVGQENSLKLRYYPQSNTNIVISNKTNETLFAKIKASVNKLDVVDGKIVIQSDITGRTVFEVKVNGSDNVTRYYNLDQIRFEENNIYKIKAYFEGTNNHDLNSDYSNEISVKLVDKISDLLVENGVISFTKNNSQVYSITVKSGEFSKTIENISALSSYSEEDEKIKISLSNLIDAIMPINYESLQNSLEIFVTGKGSNSSSEVERQSYSTLNGNSNSIFVNFEIQNTKIMDLRIEDDQISFNTVDAQNYYINLSLKANNQSLKLTSENLSSFEISDNVSGTATLSMNELIKTIYSDSYKNLGGIVEIYITCSSLNNPFTIKNNIVVFKTVNNSDSIYLNILATPTDLVATKLYDLITNSNLIDEDDIGVNKLYFNCDASVELFRLDYTNSEGTKSKVLSTNNFLKIISSTAGVNTYEINTSFLEAGKYSFKIFGINVYKGEMDDEINSYVYNYDSFESADLEDITKLPAVTSLTCENGKIIINDNTSAPSGCKNAYLLTVNGEIIYEDALGEGQDLNSLLDMASDLSKISEVISLINKFQTKERILPSSCCGEMEISVIKVVIPSSMLNFMSGGIAIQADKPKSINVTRLETVKPVMRNGVLTWNPINGAESYSLYALKLEDSKLVVDYDNEIFKITAGNELSYDLYSYLSGTAGTYSYAMIANTAQENHLSSLKSENILFSILSTPTMFVENGKLNWNAVEYAKGYKLDVYLNNELFDTLIFNSSVLFYDAMTSSKGKAIESATYEFRITSLGEIETNSLGNIIEETTTIKSLTTPANTLSAFKLQTPQKVYVQNGQIVLTSVNSNTGVTYYNLKVNDKKVIVDKTKLVVALGTSYSAGQYGLSYQAVGNDACLSSNFSENFDAEKLSAASNIRIENGEVIWNSITANNYNNGSGSIKYYFSVNKETSIYNAQTELTNFQISENTSVPFGLYSFEVKAVGDNYYYLNSDSAFLNNLVKLANIQNIRVENGVLTWTNPLSTDIIGLPANSKASPNGYKLEIKWGTNNKREYTIQDGINSFVMDENFDSGDYNIIIQNIGDSTSIGEFNFASSEKTSGSVYKLMPLTNLNISDGLNLKWSDPNTKVVTSVVLNIASENENYSGVIKATSNSIKFEDLCYYINANDEKVLILATDNNITEQDGTKTYNGFVVNEFKAQGTISVWVRAYGRDKFITSEKSNVISITMPNEVTNLKIEHGKVSWDASSDANGYILTLTRYILNGEEKLFDEDFGSSYSLVYVTKTHYNLFDVNYYYNVSVRAYSLITSDNNQTMASNKVTIENYLFNSFTSGNGSKDNPYLITDEKTLGYIKYNNVAFYKLAGDITITSSNFVPLFNSQTQFAGTFDGNYQTIKNLKISQDYEYSGIFGYIGQEEISDDRVVGGIRQNFVSEENRIQKGTVKNLAINNSTISAGFKVGLISGINYGNISEIVIKNSKINSKSKVLAGEGTSFKSIYSGSITAQNYGTIQDCYIESGSELSPISETSSYSGGICATNSGSIINCSVNAQVYGTIAGGICAINNGLIDFCSSYGSVVCENFVSDKSSLIARAGGICAINNLGARISNAIVENNSFGTTSKVGVSNNSKTKMPDNASEKIVYVGGIVGDNAGEVFNTYAKIDIFNKGASDVTCLLGFVFGYNSNNSVSNNKYVLSDVTEATKITNGETSINSSNCEIEALSQTLIEEFNSKNTTEELTDYSWGSSVEFKFGESVLKTFTFGFIKN